MTQTLLNQAVPIVQTAQFCPKCGNQVLPTDNFCPHCGYDLTNNLPLGFGRKLYIYTVALIAPPFGLIWFFKYVRSSSPDKKKAGYIVLVLTIISIVFTIWATVGFLQGLQSTYNTYTNLGI